MASFHLVLISLLIICSSLPVVTPTTLELHRVDTQGDAFKPQDERRRLLHRYHDGVVDFPVYGSFPFGYYVAKVKIGTPAREFSLLVSTGSSLTWVSCNRCSGCPTSNTSRILYNPYKSRTATTIHCSDEECRPIPAHNCYPRDLDCTFSMGKLDNSATVGSLVSDILHLDMVKGSSETIHPISINFGCAKYHRGSLTQIEKPIDGVLGLGPGGISIIPQLHSQGEGPMVFSHCLFGGSSGGGGGKLVLGEIREPGMVYTPLDMSRDAYQLNLQGIAVWGQGLAIDPKVFGSTFVDSGTNLAILAYQAYDIFIPYFIRTVSPYSVPVVANGYQCFQVSGRVEELFPTVSFNFLEGASLILKPKDYLFFDGNQWCLGFQKVEGEDTTVFGDLVLKDKIFVYDLGQQKLGWVDYDCSQTVNVSTGAHRSASNSLVDTFLKSIFIHTLAFFLYLCMIL